MKKMITRRQFMAAAGVVAAASALTACGGSSASTAASSAAGSAAASGSTIKVGVMGPLTGDASVYGQAVVNGASLYMKQVNADGGVNGKQLEIIAMDEQGDETQAVTCFTKMVDQGITAFLNSHASTRILSFSTSVRPASFISFKSISPVFRSAREPAVRYPRTGFVFSCSMRLARS